MPNGIQTQEKFPIIKILSTSLFFFQYNNTDKVWLHESDCYTPFSQISLWYGDCLSPLKGSFNSWEKREAVRQKDYTYMDTKILIRKLWLVSWCYIYLFPSYGKDTEKKKMQHRSNPSLNSFAMVDAINFQNTKKILKIGLLLCF